MAGLVNFEDEEEVRGYLENLHVEYSYQCFREKDPDGKRPRRHPGPPPRGRRAGASNPPPRCLAGCQRLADYLDAVRKDFAAAARVLRGNCETHGHSESCYRLGAYQAIGKGGPGAGGPGAVSLPTPRFFGGGPAGRRNSSAYGRRCLWAAAVPVGGGGSRFREGAERLRSLLTSQEQLPALPLLWSGSSSWGRAETPKLPPSEEPAPG